jgi:hypothetical protein
MLNIIRRTLRPLETSTISRMLTLWRTPVSLFRIVIVAPLLTI